MLIPKDAIIADEKLTRYLLVPRLWDDKSGFLAQAGFMLDNAGPICCRRFGRLADSRWKPKMRAGMNMVDFIGIRGAIMGWAGGVKALRVKLIWMQRAVDGKYYFVTLVPSKE